MKQIFIVSGLLILCFLTACNIPQDPNQTTEQVKERGIIRVGVTEAEPWVIRQGEEASGIEAELVHQFAQTQDVDIQWRWGSTETHLHQLSNYEIDLVIGGLRQSSPWSREVALTAPYLTNPENERKQVMAVPPGENRWLSELETFLQTHAAQ